MNLAPVVELLERRIGLDPASLGATVLPTAVTDGMRTLGLTDPVAYADRLADHADEFDTLVQRLVVPETWFFRGGGLFEELARIVARFPAGRRFRALSVPCSSGEEPYSLAIALLEAGVPPERWTVDGYDLDPRLVAAAGRGVYREFSFREADPSMRERYFRTTKDVWQLTAPVRDLVRFATGNLVDPGFLSGASSAYNLVLCRNLLIYLTPAARRQVVANLERLLTPGGLLAVGPAEPQALAGRPFRREGTGPYFLFRHEAGDFPHPPAPPPPQGGRGEKTLESSPPLPLWERGPGGEGKCPPLQHQHGRQSKAEPPLDRARRLADAGRLDEALVEAARAGPSADGFSLVGVIQQARGDRAAAAVAFRKALYLDPNHTEALTHAMLMADHQGNTSQATVLRERLIRSGGEP